MTLPNEPVPNVLILSKSSKDAVFYKRCKSCGINL